MAQTADAKGTIGRMGSSTELSGTPGSAAATPPVVLGPRDSLVGKLSLEGDLTIHGTVDGELRIGGDVHVEEGATVKAKLSGDSISIRGSVTGDLAARNRLTVTGSGVVNGDVKVAKLQVEDGGTLNGNISMGGGGSGGSAKPS